MRSVDFDMGHLETGIALISVSEGGDWPLKLNLFIAYSFRIWPHNARIIGVQLQSSTNAWAEHGLAAGLFAWLYLSRYELIRH